MRKLYGLLIMGLMAVHGAAAQDTGSGELSRLDWLAGRWERLDTRPGQTAFEEWAVLAAGLKGKGFTLQATDTVFVEKLAIRPMEENLYYIAEVSHNAVPTRFRITRITDSGFVCENPDHDFPKKIEYRLEGPGALQAVISGDGRSSSFTFRKISD